MNSAEYIEYQVRSELLGLWFSNVTIKCQNGCTVWQREGKHGHHANGMSTIVLVCVCVCVCVLCMHDWAAWALIPPGQVFLPQLCLYLSVKPRWKRRGMKSWNLCQSKSFLSIIYQFSSQSHKTLDKGKTWWKCIYLMGFGHGQGKMVVACLEVVSTQ